MTEKPLLSITIPTYNRSPFLVELLEILLSQLAGLDEVELLLSDNASTDDTESLVASFIRRGLVCRYIRNTENVGPDANFLQCLYLAHGKYCWVLGDDDIVTPGAVPDLVSLLQQGEAAGGFDLIYLSSFGFKGKYIAPSEDKLKDRFGRFAEVVTDGQYFLNKANALIGLISVVIINRERLLSVPHPPIETLKGSSLIQVGWIFPLLHEQCRVLYIWQRLLGYRSFNSGGWGICEVFGVGLHRIAQKYFVDEPTLGAALMDGVIRYWMSDVLMQLRLGENQGMHHENASATLRPVFRKNWRYWAFVWTVESVPLGLVRPVHGVLHVMNKGTRAVEALVRHWWMRGQYMFPAKQGKSDITGEPF